MNIRFECQPGCTNCCREHGFIYLTEDDLISAARFLGMTPADFERRYVYRTTHLRRLRTKRQARCPFLRDFGCSINDAKPAQCRLYPFWPELVDNAMNWNRAAALCPGIGKGQFVPLETIRAHAAEMRASFPTMYP